MIAVTAGGGGAEVFVTVDIREQQCHHHGQHYSLPRVQVASAVDSCSTGILWVVRRQEQWTCKHDDCRYGRRTGTKRSF